MAKKNTKAAKGGGSIRQRKDGLWEARYTVGRNPATGKPVRKSIYGNTQGEVRKKLTQVIASIDNGDYIDPPKMTMGKWLDIWAADYIGNVKPNTRYHYTGIIKNHIAPALGSVRLSSLHPHTVQGFINSLSSERDGKPGLSPSTVRSVHLVLNEALRQAVKLGYIRSNPAECCTLPRMEKKEREPIDGETVGKFLEAIKGHRFEALFTVALFTGMREGEVLGLMWDCVDFERGTILIDKQLQVVREYGKEQVFTFSSTKNGKARSISPAPLVFRVLEKHRGKQAENRLKAGPLWEDKGLVFPDELGRELSRFAVYSAFKRVAASLGMPSATFHDLRHSYAVAAIRAGDDAKTVQGNLGHATAAFTLEIYAHVTEEMKRDSASRMNAYISDVLGL